MPGTHISRRTSINLNKFNIGLPKHLCGNHAARPWLGKSRREKESKQAYHAEQGQQWACGHQQNNNTCSKVTKEPRAHSNFSKKVQTIQLSDIPSSQGPSKSGTSFHNVIPELRHTWMALVVALKPSVTYCLLYSQITRLCSLKPF